MRLSTAERDCLFQLLTNEAIDVMCGDCGNIPHGRTIQSLWNKELILRGALTGHPTIDFDGPWDFQAGRRVINEAQDYLDVIDSQGDPSLLEEPRLIDAFNF